MTTNLSNTRQDESIEAVRAFWDSHVCGELYSDEAQGTPAYYEAIHNERYRWHYHLPPFLDATAAHGGPTLEIGSGMGIDSWELAKRGVDLTAVDLTPTAVKLAQRNFERLGLRGTFLEANAENLPFEDCSFQTVYSFGVLHHSPSTSKAVAEVHRVLKPGGKAFIMLYSRISLNYFVHWMLRKPYENHREDGTDAPVTRAYTKRELRDLFCKFSESSFRKRYLFGAGYRPIANFVPTFVNDLLGRAIGWHWLIGARK